MAAVTWFVHLAAKSEAKFRDLDVQDRPCSYDIGRHALETLAIRYGIPHLTKDDKGRVSEATSINLQKVEFLKDDRYLVMLSDYKNRQAIAVIEKGKGFVKTFYPMDGQMWWSKNKDWEDALKGNTGFTIKDMARMHIDRINAQN